MVHQWNSQMPEGALTSFKVHVQVTHIAAMGFMHSY